MRGVSRHARSDWFFAHVRFALITAPKTISIVFMWNSYVEKSKTRVEGGKGGERKGERDRESLLSLSFSFFLSFRMRVARLLLCCVLLEDYSTNLGGTAITSDAMRQDGSSSATNPTLSGTYPYILICILSASRTTIAFFVFSFPRLSRPSVDPPRKFHRRR